MKKTILTFLTVAFACGCVNENQKAEPDKLAHSFSNSPMVVETMEMLRAAQSIGQVSAYLNDTYNIKDFDKNYLRLIPHIKATKEAAARTSSSDSTMLDLNSMMVNAGITKESSSYKYVKQVSEVFDGKTHSDPETILPKLDQLRAILANDTKINTQDKSKFIALTDMLSSNYEGFVHEIEESNHMHTSNSGRVQCFFCSAWRVIRSVVVTVVAVALVAAAILNPVFGVGVITALKIGAVLGGAWSIIAAAATDTCYYAINCGADDSDAAGTQYCSTGACILE